MFGVVSNRFAVLLVNSFGLFSEEQYEIKSLKWHYSCMVWYKENVTQGTLHPN
jgi:hypothetical protein